MIHRLVAALLPFSFLICFLLGFTPSLSSTTAEAAEIVVDTDALTITVDGQALGFGEPAFGGAGELLASGVSSTGIAQFTIGGDLSLSPGDTLRGIGSRPLSLLVGNDVLIASGAVIDFSAIDAVAGPGGGSSGSGGMGGAGGNGGTTTPGGQGGIGGFGSFGFGPVPLGVPPLVKATSGTAGFYTNAGEGGEGGLTGSAGGQGYGGTLAGKATGDLTSTYPVQTATRPAEGGGTGLWPPIPLPIPSFILPDNLESKGKDGLDGIDGVGGGDGATGLRGAGGSNGASSGNFSLTGGAGGAGGSGGSGGQGGQGGSGAAGGGGGQGAWVNQIGRPPFFPYWVGIGGEGGDGGSGGIGGSGGKGGTGGSGGIGGAGGGAFEINALGEIRFDGQALATGGEGAEGTISPVAPATGSAGTSGAGGQLTGVPGFSYSPLPKKLTDYFELSDGPILKPSFGTSGGDGGKGGNGGDGGDGGMGGAGGGGAGGTVKLVGSVVRGTGAVDASGGLSGDGAVRAGDGRFLVGANNVPAGTTASSLLSGSSSGIQPSASRVGNLSVNPYVADGPVVPNMTGLVGGAEAFGYTTLQADTSYFGGVSFLENSPQAAVVGAIRLDTGPDGYDMPFAGYDMVLVFNTRTDTLTNVRFGMNLQELDGLGTPIPASGTTELAPFYVLDLFEGGWANDPRFGGLGDLLNGALDGYEVYATLVPEDTPGQGLNFAVMAENAGNTFVATLDQFVNGQTLYAEFDPSVPVLESTWLGSSGLGGAGNWNVAANWATVDEAGVPVAAVVPNNSTAEAFNVRIESGIAQVAQDTVITIDQLSVGAGDQLSVLDTQRLVLERFSVRPTSGLIENNGLITLDAATAETALRLSGTGIELTGTGRLSSTDNPANRLTGIRPTDGFVHGAAHTIEMVGVLGNNLLTITNRGTIQALDSASGNWLIIDPSGDATRPSAAFVNEGALLADGPGSKLSLRDGYFQNKAGATIRATAGAELEVQNSTLDLQTGSTMEVLTGSQLTVLGDLALPAGAVIQGDIDTRMNFSNGILVNRGAILNPGGAVTFNNIEIDNTDGVIEMHLPAGQSYNVSGDFFLRNGTILGEIVGASVGELGLVDVTFGTSSTGVSEVQFNANGTILGGRIDATAIEITTGSLQFDSETRFSGDAVIYFDFLLGSGYDRIVQENPGSQISLSGVEIVGVQSIFNGDSDISVETWNLDLELEGEASLVNRGMMSASSTSFEFGQIDNEGGSIVGDGLSFNMVELVGGELIAAGSVSLSDVTLREVTLTDSGGGFYFENTAILDNVVNDNALLLAESVELKTRFTNNGQFESSSQLLIFEDLTIDGFGTIVLGEDGLLGGPATLTLLGQEILIQGGPFGGDALTIVSTSDIEGTSPDQANHPIDPAGTLLDPTPGFVNRGTIEGVLLTDGYFDNTGGEISDVHLDGVRVAGGVLLSTQGPLGGTKVIGPSTLEEITLSGTISVLADLSLRGTIRSDGTTGVLSFGASGPSLIIEADTRLESITLDLEESSFAGTLLGDPSVTLTIDGGSRVVSPLLEIGSWSPTIRNEGDLETDLVEGTMITTTLPAGSTISQIAYLLETGGDPTGVPPESTILLPNDLTFSSLPRLINSGFLTGNANSIIVLNQVALVNEAFGEIEGELHLSGSMLTNQGNPISIGLLEDSRVIGGEIDASWATTLTVSGDDNFLIDTSISLPISIDGALTLVGTTPQAGSGEPAAKAALEGAGLTGDSAELTLIGNVENWGIIDLTGASSLTVDATMPEAGEPSAFIGFQNQAQLTMSGGAAHFEGRVVNVLSMNLTGTVVTFGPGRFTNRGNLTIDQGVQISDPETTFEIEPGASLTTSGIAIAGGTFMAESAWIDDFVINGATPLTWTSGGIRLTGAAGHGVGSASVVDGLLGGTASVIGANRTLMVDQTLSIPAGASLELAGGGLRAGRLEIAGGSFLFSSGRLSFDSISASLTNLAGTLTPGESAGSATVEGDYNQQSGGRLEIEIGGTAPGTEFDVVQILGQATLAGTLEVLLIDDYSPTGGPSFEILTAAGGLGGTSFETVLLPDLEGGLFWELETMADRILLTVLSSYSADLNIDGLVDGADLAAWSESFGFDDGGDTDGDGDSDGTDFLAWQRQLGSGASSGLAAQTAVPEPSTAMLMLLSGFLICLCRAIVRDQRNGATVRGGRTPAVRSPR